MSGGENLNLSRMAVSKIWDSTKSNKVVLGNPWFRLFFTELNYVSNTASFAVNSLVNFN
jgi:hypothetical protein